MPRVRTGHWRPGGLFAVRVLLYAQVAAAITPHAFATPPHVVSAVSRKLHGSAGAFDVDLQVQGALECRQFGPTSILVDFDTAIELFAFSGAVEVSSGYVLSVSAINTTLMIHITGAANAKRLTISFPGVFARDSYEPCADTVNVNVLAGDATRDGATTLTDLGRIKSAFGLQVNENTFRLDLNCNGTIDVSDLELARNAINTCIQNIAGNASTPRSVAMSLTQGGTGINGPSLIAILPSETSLSIDVNVGRPPEGEDIAGFSAALRAEKVAGEGWGEFLIASRTVSAPVSVTDMPLTSAIAGDLLEPHTCDIGYLRVNPGGWASNSFPATVESFVLTIYNVAPGDVYEFSIVPNSCNGFLFINAADDEIAIEPLGSLIVQVDDNTITPDYLLDSDNDGVLDVYDTDPDDPRACLDSDGDGCDDCSQGLDGLGPLPDYRPFYDGPDEDGDGICDAADQCPGTIPGLPVDSNGCTLFGFGDLDRDGDIDQDDVSQFLSLTTGPAIPCTTVCCRTADGDGDGDVDQTDFGLLQRCVSGSGVSPPAQCGEYAKQTVFISNGDGGGDWMDPATWKGCVVPGTTADYDTVRILRGDTITQSAPLPKTLGLYYLERGATHIFSANADVSSLVVMNQGAWRRPESLLAPVIVRNAAHYLTHLPSLEVVQEYDCAAYCDLLSSAPPPFDMLPTCDVQPCPSTTASKQPMTPAFADNTTHRALTTVALERSECLLHDYLVHRLGLWNGLAEALPGSTTTINEQIVNGSEWEDNPFPVLRSLRHFLDPITNDGLFSTFAPADEWAYEEDDNEYSYTKFLDYYWESLTATDPVAYQAAWANTFRSVGQILHMVQDMASPDHTRDDPHMVGPSAIEMYASENYSTPWAIRALPASAVPAFSGFQRFFDTDQLGSSTTLAGFRHVPGLAEFTNVNFVSPDTMFNGAYRRPSFAETDLFEKLPPRDSPYVRGVCQSHGSWNPPETGVFVQKYAGGNGIVGVDKLMIARRLSADLEQILHQVGNDFPDIAVSINNEEVQEAYCRTLLPKAVAYSAGMVNYLFPQGVDAWVEGYMDWGAYVMNYTAEPITSATWALCLCEDGISLDCQQGIRCEGTIPRIDPMETVIVYFDPLPATRCMARFVLRGTVGNEERIWVSIIGFVCGGEP